MPWTTLSSERSIRVEQGKQKSGVVKVQSQNFCFLKTLIYNLSTPPCHGQSVNTAVTGNNKGHSRQTTHQGKKSWNWSPRKEKKSRGERKGGSAAGYRCWSKKYAFTPFKRSFLAISSGIPLIMPAQNGKKGGGECYNSSQTQSGKRATWDLPQRNETEIDQGNNDTPTVWSSI